MQTKAFDLSLADALLGLIERAPSDVAHLARDVKRSESDVLHTLSQLQALGVPIESVGDAFAFKPDVIHLDQHSLAAVTKDVSILRPHVIESSHRWLVNALSGKTANDYSHKHALFTPRKDWDLTKMYAVLPEFQTQGVGRQGRTWHSGYAQGALCSVVKYSHLPPQQLTGLSLACGAEIAMRLNNVLPTDQHVQLKWPNDLIRLNAEGYEKLGGILVELVPCKGHGGYWVVVGVGLNVGDVPDVVDTDSIGTEPRNKPASVVGLSRQQAVNGLLGAVNHVLNHYSDEGFEHWRASWDALHAFDKKNVLIEHACGTLQGECEGVDRDGALLLRTSSGLQSVFSGDVSLRPAQKSLFKG